MGSTSAGRPGKRPAALVLFLALLGLCLAVGSPAPAGAEGGGQLVAEPVLGATAAGVRQLFGPSPLEAPGEVWGVGEAAAGRAHIVRYTEASGWEAVADPVDGTGATTPLSASAIPLTATAGRTTPAGGVVTVAALGDTERSPEELIVRDPGGPLRAVPPPPAPPLPAEPVLKENEQLFLDGSHPKVLLTAVEEASGKTGAFVVPNPGNKLNTGVLHYDGVEWTRERICLVPEPECQTKSIPAGFAVLAIEAAGPGQEWMLARQLGQGEGIVLLRREAGAWRKQPLLGPLGAIFARQNPTVGGVEATIGAREHGQPLTVTSKGVWVDATVTVGAQESDATIYYDAGEGDARAGEVTGSWCDLPESTPEPARHEICQFPLGSDLPSGEGRSFAWPGSGAEGDFGTRAITGIGQGAILIFENGGFSRIPLSGNGGGSAGAALSAPDQGWLGPSYRLTREPAPSGLQPWPVPFRRPLLAVAPQPGVTVGALSSQALAVGSAGEVARYVPGVGWQPESLLTGSGSRSTPNLRGVAWPLPGFAYAVGDEGAMWMWRASTGLWEADPGAPPNLIRGNFTGIAFDPEEPEWGYAVGKQGLLLRYGKQWTQDPLPAGLSPEINITSIAFAGHEALATWMLEVPPGKGQSLPEYTGGLIVNNGSGWRVEEGAATALSEIEVGTRGFAARRVAALPDGGAVIAGLHGGVIEREAAGAPWHAVPGPLVGYPSALAAVREGGQLRAVISIGQSPFEEATDLAQALGQPPAGQAPLLTEPYPLPESGFLIRQTANGWQDEERQAYPAPPPPTDQKPFTGIQQDLPREPDPMLALLVDPDGSQGWAVGGQTGETATKEFGPYLSEGLQTAAVMRYGSAAAPPSNAAEVPIATAADEATFAIAGGAQCAGSCADLANTGIGPEVWLRAAVARAASIPGLGAFLYVGGGVSSRLDLTKVSRNEFAEEEAAYARRLDSEAGSLPVFAAPSETDLYESSLTSFGAKFSGFASPLGIAPATGIVPVSVGERGSGNYSYSFDSYPPSAAGPVRVIVLDYSTAPLSAAKQCWLARQLALAKEAAHPAIVVGNRPVGSDLGLQQLLVTGADSACPEAEPGVASAYFFKTEGNNTTSKVSWGQATIPAFGTGSLGYLAVPNTSRQGYLPASGILLASVAVASRSPSTNVAPVSVRLIPSIGSLAINARDGTLLRRSQTALFEALARRPIAGDTCEGAVGDPCLPTSPDPYLQIPARCVNGHGYSGTPCAAEIPPEYRFSSSRPDIADFVEVDPNSTNPRAVFLNGSGKPVPDPTSGLLCAFNSGTTTVSVETGGLSYSVPVTVQKGSVQRPCGTVPRTDLVAPQPPVPAAPPPPPAGQPPFKSPSSSLPPPQPPAPTPVQAPTPLPQPVAKPAPKPPPAPIPAPFFAPAPTLTPLVVIVPPPPAPSVQPTPPSGTSPVTQPATSPEPEEEDEVAFDVVHHMAALRHSKRAPVVSSSSGSEGSRVLQYGLPALILLAAIAAAGGVRRRRPPQLAYEISASRRRHSP
jgi:hypothetical protein